MNKRLQIIDLLWVPGNNIVKAESSKEDPRATGGLVSILPHPRVNKTKEHQMMIVLIATLSVSDPLPVCSVVKLVSSLSSVVSHKCVCCIVLLN